MDQSIDDVMKAWRSIQKSYAMLAKAIEDHPDSFEGKDVSSLGASIDNLLYRAVPRGTSSTATQDKNLMNSESTAPNNDIDNDYDTELQPESLSASNAHTGPPKKQLKLRKSFPSKATIASTKRSGNGYGAEEIVYLRTSWERVVAGEIERSACAAEVARTLKRSKSAIQGQFTWLKANTPRSTGMPRGRPRKSDADMMQAEMQGSLAMALEEDLAGASGGRKRTAAETGAFDQNNVRRAGLSIAVNAPSATHREEAGYTMMWRQLDVDEEPQWLTGGKKRNY